MKGVIVNFKGGRHTQIGNQMIVKVEGVDSKDKAKNLVGKKVSWKTPGKDKTMTGEVRSAHGNSGAIRVLFERGMPGQAVGQKVDIS